jgi:hypothetical protein
MQSRFSSSYNMEDGCQESPVQIPEQKRQLGEYKDLKLQDEILNMKQENKKVSENNKQASIG